MHRCTYYQSFSRSRGTLLLTLALGLLLTSGSVARAQGISWRHPLRQVQYVENVAPPRSNASFQEPQPSGDDRYSNPEDRLQRPGERLPSPDELFPRRPRTPPGELPPPPSSTQSPSDPPRTSPRAAPRAAPRNTPQIAPRPAPENYGDGPVMGPPDGSYFEEGPYFDGAMEGPFPDAGLGYGGCDTCGGSSCDGCCSAGCATGCCPPPQCLIYVGFEATFLKPYFSSNTAMTQSGAAVGGTLQEYPFTWDLQFAPRAWIGWQECDGWGMRGGFWYFDNNSSTVSRSPDGLGILNGQVNGSPLAGNVQLVPFSADPTDMLNAWSSLKATTIDLEITKNSCFGGWSVDFFGGLRYAQLRQTYQAELINAAGTLTQSATASHRFDGIGPTFAMSVSKDLGCCFSLFFDARAALLFGDGKFNSQTTVTTQSLLNTQRSSQRDDLLPMGSIRLGLDYQYDCSCYSVLYRIALESQLWQDGGSAVNEDGNLGFFGLGGTMGLKF